MSEFLTTAFHGSARCGISHLRGAARGVADGLVAGTAEDREGTRKPNTFDPSDSEQVAHEALAQCEAVRFGCRLLTPSLEGVWEFGLRRMASVVSSSSWKRCRRAPRPSTAGNALIQVLPLSFL